MGKGMARNAGFFNIGCLLLVMMTGCRGGGGAPGPAPLAPSNVTINFQKFTLDPGGNINWLTSIAVNPNGSGPAGSPQVQISYYDQSLRALKRATTEAAGGLAPLIETLDTAYDAGRYNSNSWSFGEAQAGIRYRRGHILVEWTFEKGAVIADPTPDGGMYGDSAHAHLVDGAPPVLVSASTVVTTSNPLFKRAQVRFIWQQLDGPPAISVVDDAPANAGSFSFTSIAQDPTDNSIYISYRGQRGELKLARRDSDGLVFNVINPRREIPGVTVTNVGQTSLTIGPDGSLFLAYNCLDSTGHWGICMIQRKKGQPETEFRPVRDMIIMTPSSIWCCADITGDGVEDIVIAAHKPGTKDMVLVAFEHGDIHFPYLVDVDTDGDTGKYAAIAVDGGGCIHLSYVKGSPVNDLMYATNWGPAGCPFPTP